MFVSNFGFGGFPRGYLGAGIGYPYYGYLGWGPYWGFPGWGCCNVPYLPVF